MAARPLRVVGAVVHVEPGLLDADAGDLVAGPGGDTRLGGDRYSRRHRRSASPPLLRNTAAGSRSDADAPYVRVPDPDPGAVRSGARPRTDFHSDLRDAGADPADSGGHLGCARRTQGGRTRL